MSGPVARKRPWIVRQPNPKAATHALCILAYHVEKEVASWTSQEDAALMRNLNNIHDRLTQEGRLGPAARLGATQGACVLRGRGKGVVTDGPFTEAKEQLLGFYVIDCADRNAAIAAVRELPRLIPTPSTKSARFCSICPVRHFR
jgi:hypothetical protein